MNRIAESLSRANSHLRYWRYRRALRNGGPTLLASMRDWFRRFLFEMKNLKTAVAAAPQPTQGEKG